MIIDSTCPSPRPILSIIIPTFNRPERIRPCLESIAGLEAASHRLHVIVVDDGSTPPLQPVVNEFSHRLDITCCYQKNKGPASARNLGASLSKSPFLAFLDDDCTLPSQWFAKVLAQLRSDAVMGGETINCLPDNPFAAASQALIDFLYSYFNNRGRQTRFFTSNNIIVPLEKFEKVHGFSLEFRLAAAEDRDFCDRLLHAGTRLVFIPEIKVHHHHNLSMKSYFRQHFNYGKGASLYHRLRAERKRDRIKLEPLKFYRKLIFWPFRKKRARHRLLISTLLFLSQVFNAMGYFDGKLKYKKNSEVL